MNYVNETFSVAIENVDLQFVIHYESFFQLQSGIFKASHSHLYYEVLYSLSDTNKLITTEYTVPMKKHSFVIVPPYQRHHITCENDQDIISVGFYYKKKHNKPVRDDMFAFFNSIFGKDIKTGILDSISESNFLKIRETHRRSEPVFNGLLISSLAQIIFSIAEVIVSGSSDNDQNLKIIPNPNYKSYSPKGVPMETLYWINEMLNARYMDNITPASLAKQFFVSPKQINRYIYRQYGQTFLQRRTHLRMAAAQKLLSQTSEPISKISESVGYSSINTFYSAFKTFCGTTPDLYRKEFGLGDN